MVQLSLVYLMLQLRHLQTFKLMQHLLQQVSLVVHLKI